MFTAIFTTGRSIASHPLTRDHKAHGLRSVRPLAAREPSRTEVVVPWIAGTCLAVRRGMYGATRNIYCGLHEFAEMAFTLHLLRAGDLFADIGANVGNYTVLAAGVCGARVVAVEPGVDARAALAKNITLNGVGDRVSVEAARLVVEAQQVVLGGSESADGRRRF